MRKWIHKLLSKDTDALTGVCAFCGPVLLVKKGKRFLCRRSQSRWFGNRDRAEYRLHKKDECSRCGFIAEHPSQLDVHHLDGNKSNNDLANLQTLCANCHRLLHIV